MKRREGKERDNIMGRRGKERSIHLVRLRRRNKSEVKERSRREKTIRKGKY